VWPFFEDLKNKNFTERVKNKTSNEDLDLSKVALYVITFNSPKQFQTLVDSMIQYDKNFLDKTQKFLLNNSTDRNTDEEYKKISEENGFTIIWPGENLGITGGRQFIANHFDSLELDLYFFFEDDMFFYGKNNETCKNGFNRFVPDLYQKTLEIIISQLESAPLLPTPSRIRPSLDTLPARWPQWQWKVT
jgi:hypothetical protein